MSFEVWLFTIKRLAQSYDMALLIYNQLSEEQKNEIKKEYDEYAKSN